MSNAIGKYTLVPARRVRATRATGPPQRWCYVGRETRGRATAASCFESVELLDLDHRFGEAAERLRGPFVEWVCELGSQEPDLAAWFSGRFPSKSPFQTDFFLLACYATLVRDLIESGPPERDTVVVIEDPWLFEDLQRALSRHRWVQCSAEHATRRIPAYARRTVAGIWKRCKLIGFLAVAKTVLTVARGRRFPAPRTGEDLWIFSFAQQRAFVEGSFRDPYFGRFQQFLKDLGVVPFRVLHLMHPLGVVGPMARLRRSGWPLALDVRASDLIAVFKVWRPMTPVTSWQLQGLDLQSLMRREILEEFANGASARYQIFFRAIRRFFDHAHCQTMVYFFENQPWERLLCLAARSAGNTTLVGYQHAPVPRFMLMCAIGKNEEAWAPGPDFIVTSGRFWASRLEEMGWSTTDLRVGGAWRYESLTAEPSSRASSRNRAEGKKTLLVALPAGHELARRLVEAVNAAAGQISAQTPVTIRVRPHPHTPLSELGLPTNLLRQLQVSAGSLNEAIATADCVIYHGTTVGLEALSAGVSVVRVRIGGLIDMDPLGGVEVPGLAAATEGSLAQVVTAILSRGDDAEHGTLAGQQDFFAPIAPEVWEDVLGISRRTTPRD